MKKLGFLFLLAALLFIISCAEKSDRKIKLGTRPITALMQDQVETIQIAAEQKKKVALLEFQSDSTRHTPSWLLNGLKENLTRSLAQSQQLNLSASRFVNDAFTTLGISESDLDHDHISERMAAELNADVLVRGRILSDANVLKVDVELRQREDGQIVRRLSAASTMTDTLDALNSIVADLSIKLRTELEENYETSPEIETDYADISTSNKKAYKYYIEGTKKLDQFFMEQAAPLLAKAIEIDTTFASAYYNLAHTMLRLGEIDQARPIVAKAVKYSKDLSDRERIPILALQALLDSEFYKAVQLYNQVIELYPQDDAVHYELGSYYFSIAHDYKKAIEKYETTVELNPKHKMAHNHLAYAYAYLGELDHAFFILDKYAELAPNEPNPFDSYGEILQREGRLKEAIKKYKKALSIKSDFWHSRMGLASAFQDLGRTDKADKILKDMLADSVAGKFRGATIRQLALNEIIKGNPKKAEEYIQLAALQDPDEIGYKINLLYLNPDSKEYRQGFIDAIRKEIAEVGQDRVTSDHLLLIASWALHFGLGIDLVDELLDLNIKSGGDPITQRAAIAYKLIFDFQRGRSTAETEKKFGKAAAPETFKYAGPASWNMYWRHYYRSLEIANKNGVPIRDWAAGFYDFVNASGNPHFQINGTIALAAAEYLSGNNAGAEQMVNEIGIPCEGAWKIIGPFHVQKGFHQKFWPEKMSVDRWIQKDKYSRAIFEDRDNLFDGYIDLEHIAGTGNNQAVYALLEINSKNFKAVQLRFGMNGRLKAWLNEKPVIMKNVRGYAVIDQYITTAKLRIGINYLLVRVDRALGEMGFYFRMTDMDGNRDRDILFNSPVLAIQSDTLDELGS